MLSISLIGIARSANYIRYAGTRDPGFPSKMNTLERETWLNKSIYCRLIVDYYDIFVNFRACGTLVRLGDLDLNFTGFPSFVAHQNRSPWAYNWENIPKKKPMGYNYFFPQNICICIRDVRIYRSEVTGYNSLY